MEEKNVVRGYKVFNPDWTCRDKQYTCPGHFEEDVELNLCERGMHFCKNLIDCFNYYRFNPNNKVAEVIAYGTIAENNDKCCTDKLEIVREISWEEVLELVNLGKGNVGKGNSGNYNEGDRNTGSYNQGSMNVGKRNCGGLNVGDYNSGFTNTGDWNHGNQNTGEFNCGYFNSGSDNKGNDNSGQSNFGNYNTGNANIGHYNTGDWNITNHMTGCFNTCEQTIYLFNKPSSWTYEDWVSSQACRIMGTLEKHFANRVEVEDMTPEEKVLNPDAEYIGGFVKYGITPTVAQEWWNKLSEMDKNEIRSIPNFDAEIFSKVTKVSLDSIVVKT